MGVSPLDLLGTWTLTRVVDDRREGERRDVAGSATLSEVGPDRVRWSEEGTMTWGERSVPVSRTLYVVRSVEQEWIVHFEDGRVFHPWSVGATVEHPCAPDHYTGRVDATGDPLDRWTVTWDAHGPGKDYRMVTVHTDRR